MDGLRMRVAYIQRRIADLFDLNNNGNNGDSKNTGRHPNTQRNMVITQCEMRIVGRDAIHPHTMEFQTLQSTPIGLTPVQHYAGLWHDVYCCVTCYDNAHGKESQPYRYLFMPNEKIERAVFAHNNNGGLPTLITALLWDNIAKSVTDETKTLRSWQSDFNSNRQIPVNHIWPRTSLDSKSLYILDSSGSPYVIDLFPSSKIKWPFPPNVVRTIPMVEFTYICTQIPTRKPK